MNTGERATMDAGRLGQQLRDARTARELTLEDVEQALRIRARFLAAFEAGQYDELPGAVQARGFLRNYARFLGLDEAAAVALFDAASGQAQEAPPRSRSRIRPPTSSSVPTVTESSAYSPSVPGQRRSGVVVGAVLGLLALVMFCVGGAVLIERVLNADASREGPDLISILPTLPSLTPSATFVASPTPPEGARVEVNAPPITDRVVLDVLVVQRTYIRVTADGTQIFEGLVRPGTQLQYQAQQILNIQASNGSGLDVVFNNLPLGTLGLRGEAVDTTFTPDLVLTPTPDEAPTATHTPIPSPTIPGTPGEGEADAGAVPSSSGKSGQGVETAPTALPLPGQAQDVVGTAEEPAQPSVTPLPAATATPMASPTSTATPTRTPTSTLTPTATITPSPTPVLPPRRTSTPVGEKQA